MPNIYQRMDTGLEYLVLVVTRRISAIFLASLFVFTVPTTPSAQTKTALTGQDLQPYTHYFNIENGVLIGEGANWLAEEFRHPQFVILGEYHGSLRISEFARAIIPSLSTAGFRTLALEVGPISAEILYELSSVPERTSSELRKLNTRYLVEAGSRSFTPIPFFSNVEDAEFLAEARKRSWRLIGLDQEGSFAHFMLIDRMYDQLTNPQKVAIRSTYLKAIQVLKATITSKDKSTNRYKTILESKEICEFLEKASTNNSRNRRIADALRFSTHIFHMNDGDVRKYYEANVGRVGYMKKNLSNFFARAGGDLRSDKMLLKMGSVHTGRGFSSQSLFEVGNMLSELAEINGTRSLHIEFGSRFYVEDGKEVDALADEDRLASRYQALGQMSKNDRWTVIDLRPIRDSVFYSRRFDLDPIVFEIIKKNDLYIMPPTERDPTPNYERRLLTTFKTPLSGKNSMDR